MIELFSSVSTFFFPPKRKCVQKTNLDFLVRNANLYSNSRHTVQICFFEERKIWTHLRKSGRTEIVWGFRLWGSKRFGNPDPMLQLAANPWSACQLNFRP